jgi:hypothetical protein
MEKMTVIGLLDKYWQAETTLEEEKALADYFRGASIDPELASFRELFAYFDEEARVMPNPGFGDRILQHIGIAPDQSALGQLSTKRPGIVSDQPARVIRPFGTGLLSAAAVIAALVIGLFLLAPPAQQGPSLLAAKDSGHAGNAFTDAGNSLATIRHGAIQDTYDDPEQALAVVRHALLVASTHLNEGRQELTGDHK